jgi:hypothetical protein
MQHPHSDLSADDQIRRVFEPLQCCFSIIDSQAKLEVREIRLPVLE